MDIGQPNTATEEQDITGMVQYYRYMRSRWSHIVDPMTEADSGTKGRKILWNDALEEYFKELKCVVSDETLLGDPDCKIPFMVHTNASDKKLGAVISHNNKHISLLSIRLIKPQHNYTTTEEEILAIF